MIENIKKFLWLFLIHINACALEIRQPLKHEIEEVAELYYNTWHDTFDTLSPQPLVKQRTKNSCLTQWQEYYNKGGKYFVLVALEDKKIVGTLFGGPLENKCQIECSGYDSEIDKLYVDSTLRNNGVGSSLLKAGFNQLRTLGFKKTVICSLATNENSNKFYKKKGGVLIGHSDGGAMNIYGFDLSEIPVKLTRVR